ncbi:MAG: RNA polymerase sigma factor [Egibacteraceae bacterium]
MRSQHGQSGTRRPAGGASVVDVSDDSALLERLRAGDETAFRQLVTRYHRSMVRVARAHVPTDAVAEEVVQEAWLGVLRGLNRFEGRSSVKTWIFRIVANRAKTRGAQERRTVAFSSLAGDDADAPGAPAVDPDRFLPPDHSVYPGHWSSPPRPFGQLPEERATARELRERINQCIDLLPPRQRAIITLRDVEGWSAAEVCGALGLTDANQRVLLHRARSKVRSALEQYITESMVNEES